MATSKFQDMSDAVLSDERHGNRHEHETTIAARVIKTISVSMSLAEMDALVATFGRDRGSLTTPEQRLQAEFIEAVEEVRF